MAAKLNRLYFEKLGDKPNAIAEKLGIDPETIAIAEYEAE